MNHSKLDTKYNYIFLLIPLVLGIIAYVVFLVGLTLARFSTNMTLNNQSIIAANFDIEVIVTSVDDTIPIEKNNGKYSLESGKYKITIKRTGSSKDSSGYSTILIGDKNYVSTSLSSDEPLEFILEINSSMDVIFEPVWGEVPGNAENKINNNDTVSVLVDIPNPEITDGASNSEDEIQSEGTDQVVDNSSENQNGENGKEENSQNTGTESIEETADTKK